MTKQRRPKHNTEYDNGGRHFATLIFVIGVLLVFGYLVLDAHRKPSLIIPDEAKPKKHFVFIGDTPFSDGFIANEIGKKLDVTIANSSDAGLSSRDLLKYNFNTKQTANCIIIALHNSESDTVSVRKFIEMVKQKTKSRIILVSPTANRVHPKIDPKILSMAYKEIADELTCDLVEWYEYTKSKNYQYSDKLQPDGITLSDAGKKELAVKITEKLR